MYRSALLSTLLLTGCVGSVAVDGAAGSFGAASSGSLVELKADDASLWIYAVSSRPGLCSNLQDAYPAAMDAVDRWGFAIFDGDACDQLWSDLDDAWADVLGNGVNFSFISRSDGADFTRPSEGEFDVGAGDWSVSFAYQDTNVYSTLVDEEVGCEPGDAGELTESFSADSGSLTVSGDDDSGWRLDFDVALEDERGDDAGEAVGSFATTVCEVDLVGTTGFEWVAGAWATPWLLD